MIPLLTHRPRRLRENPWTRNLVADTSLSVSNLIQPYFVIANPKAEEPIPGFTGVSRLGREVLLRRMEADCENGVRSFLFFAHIPLAEKDAEGTASRSHGGVLPDTIRAVRSHFGSNVLVFTDVCLCPFTSHGHCGLVEGTSVLNDPSVSLLSDMALVHAEAGADFVAPSDMMDGRIGAIRQRLDANGFEKVGILAYTAKYASNYYGPFREALSSAPVGMDRASYQMDFRNEKSALRELELDLEEGADMVMVKPALAYLDIIRMYRERSTVPVVAYSVSGEYQLVKQLAQQGLADERKLALENLFAIRRAGAEVILTYFASQLAQERWLT